MNHHLFSAEERRTTKARTCAECGAVIRANARYVSAFGLAETASKPERLSLCLFHASSQDDVGAELRLVLARTAAKRRSS